MPLSTARMAVIAAGLIFGCAATSAVAYSGGIVDHSGEFGVTCNACHSGGIAPDVTLVGPTQVLPGAVHVFELVLSINGSLQRSGGLNVSADGGTLDVAEAGTQTLLGQLTHTASRPANQNNDVIWQFLWQAPLSAGQYTIYAAGNAVNGSQGSNGDLASATTLAVDVLSGASPGEASGDTLQPLLVTAFDAASGTLSLDYEIPCEATSSNIYFGPLNQVGAHGYTGEDCDIGASGSYASFNPGSDSYFFIVVGTNGAEEGSYGTTRQTGGAASERPEFSVAACGQTQTLADRCD